MHCLHPVRFASYAAQLRLQHHERVALAGPRRTGLITRWEPNDSYGFATDSSGLRWFVSIRDLPPGLDQLPVNTVVSFAGSPHCAPGKKHPRAYSIRLEQW
jgi:hypothetical protein